MEIPCSAGFSSFHRRGVHQWQSLCILRNTECGSTWKLVLKVLPRHKDPFPFTNPHMHESQHTTTNLSSSSGVTALKLLPKRVFVPLERNTTALPRSRFPFQLWVRRLPPPPSSPLFKQTYAGEGHACYVMTQQRTETAETKTEWEIWGPTYQSCSIYTLMQEMLFFLCPRRGDSKLSTLCNDASFARLYKSYTSVIFIYPHSVTVTLTPLVVFAMLGVSFHAVVQFHQDRFQAGVHPLDQFVVHHQRPQQHAQHWGSAQTFMKKYDAKRKMTDPY